MDKNIIEQLNEGEDWQLREMLTNKIAGILNKSNRGEIGIGEYIREMKKIEKEGEEYLKEIEKMPIWN